ncbi:MAG TPA: hypothetical protein V6D47_00210 [Oscillatoriaceae cyanobacterium]
MRVTTFAGVMLALGAAIYAVYKLSEEPEKARGEHPRREPLVMWYETEPPARRSET